MEVPDISVNSENLVSPSKLAIDCLSVYAAKMLMPGAVISGCTKKIIQHITLLLALWSTIN
jgi:hypothetical protein